VQRPCGPGSVYLVLPSECSQKAARSGRRQCKVGIRARFNCFVAHLIRNRSAAAPAALHTMSGIRVSGPIFGQAIFLSFAFCQNLSDFGTTTSQSSRVRQVNLQNPRFEPRLTNPRVSITEGQWRCPGVQTRSRFLKKQRGS
jgi:hypothetical protein